VTNDRGAPAPGAANAVLYLRVSTKEQASRGGEAEGYSIPAQRDACRRRAETLGANIVAEYVDAGESARSADRPQLQAMLASLEADPPQYLIVHKIDRLARNRLDDLMISVALEQAGVALVSCSENIDRTPSGKLTHGLMALIAEWYSSNLSHEVKTKSLQKVRNGGTVGKAPVGYRNIRVLENGREIRTVGIDEERAPLVRWAFEEYASGEQTLISLTAALADRGLTSPATARHVEKPLPKATVHRMLRSRYYVGKVSWQGIEYEGSHEPLITTELFQRVQDVLDAHNQAGEKQRRHHHYLKGSVWCASCGSRLCITKSTNRHGTRYDYFFCVGRHQRRTDCTQSVIPIATVEEQVEEKWRHVQLDPHYADLLRQLLTQEIAQRREQAERDAAVATRKIQMLTEQRKKLLDAHYANAIPLDLLRSEQERIGKELEAAERLLEAARVTHLRIESTLEKCLSFLTDCHRAYIEASAKERRLMNQAVFERFLVGEDGIAEAEPKGIFGVLLDPGLVQRPGHAKVRVEQQVAHRDRDWHRGMPANLYRTIARLRPSLPLGLTTPRPAFAGLGLKETQLVPPMGHLSSPPPRPAFAGLGLKEVQLVPPTGFEPVLPA
jgi:site-specific DNA recombinase